MYLVFLLTAAFFFLGTFSAEAQQEPQQTAWTGNLNVFLGQKELDETDWAPADEQDELAVEFNIRRRSWPVNLVYGYRIGTGEGTVPPISVDVETSELSLGIRRIWEGSLYVRPFFGVGLAFIKADTDVTLAGVGTVSDSDSGFGIWLDTGVYWTLLEHLNIGLDVRYSYAKVRSFDVNVDAGGIHFGVLLGYHF